MYETLSFIIDNQPAFSLENAPYYVAHTLIIFIVFTIIRMVLHLLLNKQLGLTSKPYSSTEVRDRKILVLGDSTAVGTGASKPEDTIAGRLAHDFPDAQVVNLSQNGGLIRDVRKQIDMVLDQKFDLIIISAGGNDVWHHSSLKGMRTDLTYILQTSKKLCNHRVIFLMYSIIASAPLFPAPIRFFLTRRSVKVQEVIHEIARSENIPTIELFTTDTENPFIQKPEELFASDGIHPSSRGYQVWYHRMWLEMTKNGFRV